MPGVRPLHQQHLAVVVADDGADRDLRGDVAGHADADRLASTPGRSGPAPAGSRALRAPRWYVAERLVGGGLDVGGDVEDLLEALAFVEALGEAEPGAGDARPASRSIARGPGCSWPDRAPASVPRPRSSTSTYARGRAIAESAESRGARPARPLGGGTRRSPAHRRACGRRTCRPRPRPATARWRGGCRARRRSARWAMRCSTPTRLAARTSITVSAVGGVVVEDHRRGGRAGPPASPAPPVGRGPLGEARLDARARRRAPGGDRRPPAPSPSGLADRLHPESGRRHRSGPDVGRVGPRRQHVEVAQRQRAGDTGEGARAVGGDHRDLRRAVGVPSLRPIDARPAHPPSPSSVASSGNERPVAHGGVGVAPVDRVSAVRSTSSATSCSFHEPHADGPVASESASVSACSR